MVHSVMAVSTADKLKRDAGKTANSYGNGKKEQSLFSEILQKTVEEEKAPRECRTLTYGQDSRLHPFLYQQREYRY